MGKGNEVRRNDPCPCGSGKKYKHCCLRGISDEFALASHPYGQGNARLALETARRGLENNPRDAKLLVLAGLCLIASGNPFEAQNLFRRSLVFEPNNTDALTNLGVLVAKHGGLAEAERLYRSALANNGNHSFALLNLGDLLANKGLSDEAEDLFARAIKCNPDFPGGHYSMGHLLATLGRWDESETAYRTAMKLDPNNPLTQFNLACLLLGSGKFEEGWKLFEIRSSPGLPGGNSTPPPVDITKWTGQSLYGKKLLVWPEQGFGDQIQFVRYLTRPEVVEGADVTLVCKPALKGLFIDSGLADRVFAMGEAEVFERAYDYWVFPISFPYLCKTRLNNIPDTLPYLKTSSSKREYWAGLLPKSGFRVALVWRGSPTHDNDARRSLPGLEPLAPLWRVDPQIVFVSLQKGAGEEEASAPPDGLKLFDLGSMVQEFSDSAAILESVDLVICADTAIAHLAGAMGKKCWVLLPSVDTDWRWLRTRVDSPWYPDSVRLFRQMGSGDWSELIKDVCSCLAQQVSDHYAD